MHRREIYGVSVEIYGVLGKIHGFMEKIGVFWEEFREFGVKSRRFGWGPYLWGRGGPRGQAGPLADPAEDGGAGVEEGAGGAGPAPAGLRFWGESR